VFILKALQVPCFDALLQVFIPKVLRARNCCNMWQFLVSVDFRGFATKHAVPTKKANQEVGVPGRDYTFTRDVMYHSDIRLSRANLLEVKPLLKYAWLTSIRVSPFLGWKMEPGGVVTSWESAGREHPSTDYFEVRLSFLTKRARIG